MALNNKKNLSRFDWCKKRIYLGTNKPKIKRKLPQTTKYKCPC